MLNLIEGYAWVIKATLAAAIFVVGWWLGDTLKQGEWDAVRVAQAEVAAQQIKAARDRADAAEIALAKSLNEVSTQYQKKLKEKDREKADAVARAKSNGLWVNATCEDSGDKVPDTTTPAGGRNGETRARLSERTGEDLISLATRANKVVEQLTACQKALIDQERLVNDQQPKD